MRVTFPDALRGRPGAEAGPAIQAAINTAIVQKSGAGDILFDFGDGVWKTDRPWVFDYPRLQITGRGAEIKPDGLTNDFTLKSGPVVKKWHMSQIAVETTPVGAIKISSENRSQHRGVFEDMTISRGNHTNSADIGIEWDNQSSICTINRVTFDKVTHPLDNLNGDKIVMRDSWVGAPPERGGYVDGGGMILMRRGELVTTGNLFARGPDTPLEDIAFFVFGTGVDQADDHASWSSMNDRLAFEDGAETWAHWKVPHKGTAIGWQTGIEIRGNRTSPRPTVQGGPVPPLIRIWPGCMPHHATIDGVWYNGHRGTIFAAGGGADMEVLAASAVQGSYEVKNVDVQQMDLIDPLSSTAAKTAWAGLFNI